VHDHPTSEYLWRILKENKNKEQLEEKSENPKVYFLKEMISRDKDYKKSLNFSAILPISKPDCV
jgi:hypothetical protein